MFGFALREWFSDWPDTPLFYDDAWPRSLLGLVVGLGIAGAAGVAWASRSAPELFQAAIHPAALAPSLPMAVLLAKWWFSDDARHLPIAMVAHVIGAVGLAVLVGSTGALPRAHVTSWITCAGLLTMLATFALGRASVLLVFYMRLQREEAANAARARSLLAVSFEAGSDVLVRIGEVTDETIELAVLDARGERPARAPRALLPRVHRGFFVLERPTLIDEPVATEGSYRDAKRGLRVSALSEAKYIGHAMPDSGVSWGSSIVVGAGILALHQIVLGGAAWLMARSGAV